MSNKGEHIMKEMNPTYDVCDGPFSICFGEASDLCPKPDQLCGGAGGDKAFYCTNCDVGACEECISALHSWKPNCGDHTAIAINEKPDVPLAIDSKDPSFSDVRDSPQWFRYGCKAATRVDKGSIEAGVTKLLPRPGGHQESGGGFSAQREVKSTAVTKLHLVHCNRSQISSASLNAASKMLCNEEMIGWNNDHFAAAALEVAEVLTVDDKLIQELNTKNEPMSDARGWSLWMRMSMINAKVEEFAAFKKTALGEKNKTTQPALDDVGKRFERFKNELDQLDSLLEKYSFGEKYRALALKYELVTIYKFSKWCHDQQRQQEAFLKQRRCGLQPPTPERYCMCCMIKR